MNCTSHVAKTVIAYSVCLFSDVAAHLYMTHDARKPVFIYSMICVAIQLILHMLTLGIIAICTYTHMNHDVSIRLVHLNRHVGHIGQVNKATDCITTLNHYIIPMLCLVWV